MICGLVVTHGRFGEELLRAVELVVGPVAGVKVLSNEGRSQAELAGEIQHWVRETGVTATGLMVLVDDLGGSCGNAARIACGPDREVEILGGLNLAMLLGFAAWRHDVGLPELAPRLVVRGRESVSRVDPLTE